MDVAAAERSPSLLLNGCLVGLRHQYARMISSAQKAQRPLGLDLRPDRGRPTLNGWWAPRGGGHGSTNEVELSTHPTDTQTLDRSRGSTTTSTAVPGQSRSTTQGFLIYSDRRCPCADLPQRTFHGIN
nr:unnamed protein product [Digitaria exilis]